MVPVKQTTPCLVLLVLLAAANGSATEIPGPVPLPQAEPTVFQQAGDLLLGRPVAAVRLVAGIAMLPITLPVALVLWDLEWALEVCIQGPLDALIGRPIGAP